MTLRLNGSTSGYVEIDAPAVAGTTSITIPATSGEAVVKATNGSVDLGSVDIDSSGRLLVGTSSSSDNARAVFQGRTTTDPTGQAVIYLQRGSSGPGVLGAGSGLADIHCADSNGYIAASLSCEADGTWGAGGNDYPGRWVFKTTADGASSPTERMRIGSNGRVFIGCTTSPSASVFGTLISNDLFQEGNKSSVNSTGSIVHWIFFNPNGGVGSISTNGSATSYNTSSDYRLKENVTAVTDGITRLQQLKPSRFNFITDPDTTVDGFLAHEVQDVVPEAITGEKDAVDEDGNPIYQGIDQSKLVPLLTAALQEAVAKIETLEARIAALEVTP